MANIFNNKKFLSIRIKSRLEQRELLDEVIDAMIDRAIAGDVSAFREIADRIEGKVAQRVETTGADGAPVESNINVTFKSSK